MKISLDNINNLDSNYDRNKVFDLEFNGLCLIKSRDTDIVPREISIERMDNLSNIVDSITNSNIHFEDIIIWLNS